MVELYYSISSHLYFMQMLKVITSQHHITVIGNFDLTFVVGFFILGHVFSLLSEVVYLVLCLH